MDNSVDQNVTVNPNDYMEDRIDSPLKGFIFCGILLFIIYLLKK
jgi:hypothetical protein